MFTKNRKPSASARATSNASLARPRKRGRPRGRTATGDATRQRLFRAAIDLIGERGYDAATLRDVAKRAQVSPGLLYRYFPDKRSVVLALYDELSEAFAERATRMPSGKWRDRFMHALELSLDVLGPHRVTLRALAPVLLGDVEEGVFARKTAFSRQRVQAVFQRAVVDASDAPTPALAHAIGRLLYLAHLGVILWWLLDRSPAQRATTALIGLLRQMLPSAALALQLRPMKHLAESLDTLFAEALLNDS